MGIQAHLIKMAILGPPALCGRWKTTITIVTIVTIDLECPISILLFYSIELVILQPHLQIIY
jgi:hypothetical protein